MIPVTVLMPVFNGERHISNAIRSVLNQTFREFELLVVDDGSTDSTVSLVKAVADPRLRLIRNPENLGLVATLNRGLDEALGTFVARLDADDLMAASRLAEQVSFLRGNPSVPLVGSDARLIDENDRWCGRWRTARGSDWIRWDCAFRTPFAHSSVMFRRCLIRERFGGYQNHRACEDLDLWGRVAAEFPVTSLSSPLVSYRLHRASVMGIENAGAGRGRIEAEYEVLLRNQRTLAPGSSLEVSERLAGVWSGRDANPDWSSYFDAMKDVELGFLRGRPAPGVFRRLVADQHYMLACRLDAAGRIAFLTALWRCDRTAFLRLPWMRLGWRVLR